MNLRKLFEKKIEEIPIAHEEQRGEKSYVLLPPRVIREKNLSDGNEFTYEIRAFSKYFDEIDTMRDYLIRVGTQVGEEIEINNFETYLHAVSHSISRVSIDAPSDDAVVASFTLHGVGSLTKT